MPRPRQRHLAILAGEPGHEPFLLLPAVAAAPRLGAQIGWKLVAVPIQALGDDADRGDAGFLVQLPQCRLLHILVLVNPALRHLPPGARSLGLPWRIVPPSDPDLAGTVQHHDPNAWSVSELLSRHD